ncbi:hypothetical protein C2E23DRAFT_844072 [Lenzites betulinus]|nr:hypothetical protein C2E23DRAFT_844072 [Lenzites betulinus]
MLRAILLGTCTVLIFYGLMGHQTYRYFYLYPNDVALLKVLVAILMSLETFHSMLCIHMCYYYLTTNYFNPMALLTEVWSLRIIPLATGIAVFVCHGFYFRRVYLIGGRYRLLMMLVPTLMFAELVFAIAATVATPEMFEQSLFDLEHYTWLISTGFGCAVGVDLILTSSLISVLQRRRTGFKRTDSMIDILIVYTINTGLLTGIISTLSLIISLVYPNKFLYIGFSIVAAQCYANSVLAVLNSRCSVFDQWAGDHNVGTFGMRASALDADESRLRAPVQADNLRLPRI